MVIVGDLYAAKEAEQLCKQALEVSKARQAYQRALQGFEITLGYDSPLTIKVSRDIELLETGVPKCNFEPEQPHIVMEVEQQIIAESNKTSDGCSYCERIRSASYYTPVNLPTPVFVDWLRPGAGDDCSSCQFLRSILRLRAPDILIWSYENRGYETLSYHTLSVSWRLGQLLEHGASSNPSKNIFLVWNGNSPRTEENCKILEVFTLPDTQAPCPWWELDFPKTRYSVALENSSSRNLIQFWKGMVSDYTKLSLSVPADRLPAMAGMAKFLERSIGSPYLVGLWQDSLVEDMLWMGPREERTGRRAMLDRNTPSQHLPTWSWASIEGRVVYPPNGQFPMFASNCAKVEHDTDGGPQIMLHLGDDHVIHQDFRRDYDYDHGGMSDHIPDGLGFRPDYDLWQNGSDHVPAGTALTCLLM
ncbi:hypothetical protein CHU98_g7800 [Xylaria longipes]|nr:hypothetical protein CHU98_g7800 [Xylaria longipes]